jgi:ribosomal protein S18 acetylase RimI-like enzyme
MQPLIREATASDAVSAKLCVASAFTKYIERIGKEPAPMLLDFSAEVDAKHVWVAELNTVVVGVLVQYETEFGFYIDTVAVLPESQGTGVGRALLLFAEQEAVQRDFSSLYLCTNSKMTENQILYPRIGYVEFDRQVVGGYDRVFYRKQLKSGQQANDA